MARLYTEFVEFINIEYGNLYKAFDRELNLALEEESQKLTNKMEEQEQMRQQAEEAADAKFRDVTNEHTVQYEVNETMSPQEFESFTKKLNDKGLSFNSAGGNNLDVTNAPKKAGETVTKEVNETMSPEDLKRL